LSDACLAPQGTKRLQPVIDFCIPPQGLKSGGSAPAFVPTDISDLQGWWDAEFKELNGGDVSKLIDQSGNGNDLLQTIAADQPIWNATDANFGNKASMTFDGTTELMELAAFAAGDLSQPNTIFVVGKFDTEAHGNILMSGMQAFRRHEFSQISNNSHMYAGASISASGYDSTPRVHAGRFNSTSSDYFWDGGTAIATGDVSTQDLRGYVMSGSNTAGTGKPSTQCAALVYNKLLSNSEMNQVGNFFGDRFALTWTDI